MLRVSSQVHGDQVNLQSLVSGASVSSGVPGDTVLLEFAEAVFAGDPASIAGSREAVSGELGESAMIDAAAVIANFHRMVRIADATGIPLDTQVAALSADIRENLNINEYSRAEDTPEPALWQVCLARMLRPVLPRILKRIAQRG